MKKLTITFIILLLVGCDTPYIQPTAGENSAELIMKSDKWFGGKISFSSVSGEGCHKYEGLIGWLYVSKSATAKIRTNKTTYIKTNWFDLDSNGFTKTAKSCVNIISFIPLNDHRYEITEILYENSCESKLIDLDTHQPPDSFKVIPFPQTCTNE